MRFNVDGGPLGERAAACGYANPTYLKNLFKKRYSMTMRDFRNLYQKT